MLFRSKKVKNIGLTASVIGAVAIASFSYQNYQTKKVTALEEVNELAPNHFPLHLVESPPRDCRLGREEVFGPILILYPYEDIQEAIEWINAGERPLALYYFGKDKAEERRVLDNTVSGGVTINNVAQHPAADDAPFGGIGASGMGAYHGREGFAEFSHARTI